MDTVLIAVVIFLFIWIGIFFAVNIIFASALVLAIFYKILDIIKSIKF